MKSSLGERDEHFKLLINLLPQISNYIENKMIKLIGICSKTRNLHRCEKQTCYTITTTLKTTSNLTNYYFQVSIKQLKRPPLKHAKVLRGTLPKFLL